MKDDGTTVDGIGPWMHISYTLGWYAPQLLQPPTPPLCNAYHVTQELVEPWDERVETWKMAARPLSWTKQVELRLVLLNFDSNGPNDNTSLLVQIIIWRRQGSNELPEPMIKQFTYAYIRHQTSVLTHSDLVMPYGDMEMGQHWLR